MPVAFITGASAGIGAALARELHRRGWTVGLLARNAELLDGLARELGERAAWAAVDVSDLEAVRAACADLEQRLGPCELMVANAGLGPAAPATRLDPVEAARTLRVNVEGVLFGVAVVLPGMLARGRGHLAAVSSLAGWRGMPLSGPYSASKAAVTALMESFRVELAPRGIAVTTIHPGFVETAMTKKNRFPMPFLMSAERAARLIADGLERRRAEINFPFGTTLAMRIARLLPNFLYDRLIRRVRKG